MRNQVKIGMPQYARWYPCPSAVTSGMPVLIGTQAAVAMDDYDSSTGGTNFMLDGSYNLTVIGQSTQSPNSNQSIAVGAELYASGTLDATTNVTYNLTIDVTRGNCPFGNLEAPVAGISAGVTSTTAVVRLKVGGSPGPYAP
jgi:predicted RecA/RadA family phage recombinase